MTNLEYQYAQTKSDKDLVSYQGVRGADVKLIATNLIGPTPIEQVHRDFVRPANDANKDSVENTLQFIQSIDFVDKPDDRVVEPIENQPFSDSAFEVRILHHINKQLDSQDHLIRIHEVLVERERSKESRMISKTDLKEDLDREADDYPFSWNVEKVEMWYNLLAPMGLVSIKDNTEIGTAPSPALMFDLFEVYSRLEGSSSLYKALYWVEENFFACFASRAGIPRVHLGLSDTLETMIHHDVLELKSPSDASNEVEVPATESQHVSRFELSDRPDRPAYRHALEHDEVARK